MTAHHRPASGTDLARRFHDVVVAPLLQAHLPGLPHAAARLGSGSDVLVPPHRRHAVTRAVLESSAG